MNFCRLTLGAKHFALYLKAAILSCNVNKAIKQSFKTMQNVLQGIQTAAISISISLIALGGFSLAAQAQTECAAKSDGDVAVAACVDADGNTAVTAVDSDGNQVTVTEDSEGNKTTEVIEVSQ